SPIVQAGDAAMIFNVNHTPDLGVLDIASNSSTNSVGIRINAAAKTLNFYGASTFNSPVTAPSFSGTGTATFTLGSSTTVGTGATVGCATSHTCDNVSGTVELVTGTSITTNGTAVTVNLATRATAPNCSFSLYDPAYITGGYTGGALHLIATTVNGFTVGVYGNNLSASVGYFFTYTCFGS